MSETPVPALADAGIASVQSMPSVDSYTNHEIGREIGHEMGHTVLHGAARVPAASVALAAAGCFNPCMQSVHGACAHNLRSDTIDVGAGQVNLVEHRDNGKLGGCGELSVCNRLRLDAL